MQSGCARLDCRHFATSSLGGHLLGTDLCLLDQAELFEAMSGTETLSTAFSLMTIRTVLGSAKDSESALF